MKCTTLILKIFAVTMFCLVLIYSCKKEEPNATNTNTTTTSNVNANADSLSDHLQFLNASKKSGKIPQGPASSSLKISFEDTLYLMDQVKIPIHFLHLDTTQNVAGVFLQVHMAVVGGQLDASYYYDVPEIADSLSGDTVSVIMVGIDPAGMKLPLSFDITITPYDENDLPLAQVTRPVKIVEHTKDPKATDCGIVLPTGEFWDWEMSYMTSSSNNFRSSPSIVFGKKGQTIKGSCCAGISIYGICPGVREPNSSLHFKTFYQIASEVLLFIDDGTYLRSTVEKGANPLPDISDFCGNDEGSVSKYTNNTLYTGGYVITPAILPPDLQALHDSLRVSMITSTSTPASSGFGNPGGVIHQVDCQSGRLILIQVDPEGFGQHLYKIYKRRSRNQDDRWYTLAP